MTYDPTCHQSVLIPINSLEYLGIHLQALAIAFAPRLQLPWWKVDLYRTRRELATWTQMDTAKYNVTIRYLIHGSVKMLGKLPWDPCFLRFLMI